MSKWRFTNFLAYSVLLLTPELSIFFWFSSASNLACFTMLVYSREMRRNQTKKCFSRRPRDILISIFKKYFLMYISTSITFTNLRLRVTNWEDKFRFGIQTELMLSDRLSKLIPILNRIYWIKAILHRLRHTIRLKQKS